MNRIWNTSVWWGYVYQWWMSAFMYCLLIQRSTGLIWNIKFNRQISKFRDLIDSRLPLLDLSNKDLYLEWNDAAFEDINYLQEKAWEINCCFMQVKTAFDTTKAKSWTKELRHILYRFFRNEHHGILSKIVFVIASNISIQKNWSKEIDLTKDWYVDICLWILTAFYYKKWKSLSVPGVKTESKFILFNRSIKKPKNIIDIIKSHDRVLANKVILKRHQSLYNWNQLIDDILKIEEILKNIVIFENIAQEDVISYIETVIQSPHSSVSLFQEALNQATRKKNQEVTDNDYSKFLTYSSLKFWINPETNIIEWGFLEIA